MTGSILASSGAVPVITAIVQVAKGAGLPARWAAPCAIGFGAVVSVAVALTAGASPVDVLSAALAGVTAGLGAAGLYSGGRAVRNRAGHVQPSHAERRR